MPSALKLQYDVSIGTHALALLSKSHPVVTANCPLALSRVTRAAAPSDFHGGESKSDALPSHSATYETTFPYRGKIHSTCSSNMPADDFASVARKLRTLLRKLWRMALGRFINLVGELGAPGTYPSRRLQAWALRRMGVTCPSNEVYVGPGTRFDNPEYVVLGSRVQIGPGSRVTGWATVTFGNDFISGPELMINTGGHDLKTLVCQYEPVTIGARVWCGMRVTICSGVVVGDDAVVGAGAVVTTSLPARHLAVGVPCRPVREIDRPDPNDSAPLWSSFDSQTASGDREELDEPLPGLVPKA